MLFLRSLFEAIYSARNTLDYSLRRRIHWRRGGVPFRNEPKKDLFNDLPPGTYELAHEAEVRLRQEYHLQAFYTDSTCENYRENLFYLEMLERALGTAAPQFTSTISACDIGPSSWFYVQALAALLQWWGDSEIGREAALYGYEVDAYRVYADFRSRCDHALAHMRDLSDVHYIPASFRRQDGKFDVITHLFPFILLPDHLIWGLPRPLFQPLHLLQDAWESLKPGGLLIIANQGEKENETQLALLKKLDIQPLAQFRHESLFFDYDLSRYVTVCRRPA